jgi:hypothetical protein
LSQQDRRLLGQLEASGAGGALAVAIEAEHDLDSGAGKTELGLRPMTFAPTALQPHDLSDRYNDITRTAGKISGRAELAWSEDELTSTGRLALTDLAFDTSNLSVDGLDLELALSSLLPPRSRPDQLLTVQRLTLGPTLRDVAVRFQVTTDKAGNPVVLVRDAEMSLAGGTARLRDGRLAPASRQYKATVTLDDVDLGQAVDLIGLEELRGEGRLNGSVPIEIDGELVTIAEGEVAASQPGMISFTSPEARTALASGGEPVDLMLRALEDFRYEALSVAISKPGAGEALLSLRLEGQNPAVLDGRPFKININLSGDVAPLIAAVIQGQRLSSKLLREMWRFEP